MLDEAEWSALLVDAARVPIYLVSASSVIASAAPLWLAASLGVTLGTFLGVPILGRIPETTSRRLIGALLLLLGVSLLITSL